MAAHLGEDSEEALDEALAGYLRDFDAGRLPDRRDLTARFPELASDIEQFLAQYEQLDAVFAPLRPVARAAAESENADGESTAVYPPNAAPFPALPDLDGYDLLEPLGRGGMGIVYRARHLALNRLVALKFDLTSPWAAAAERQRFRTEAEAVAHLDHPHIVPIYEVGESQGQAFLSMKLLDGGSLAEQLDRFRADPKAAARLMVPVARAVHYAHQRGILHRDLKPANVLLDAAGEPYVSDFGLAKRLAPGESIGDPTQTGALVGTPAYVAPEQASGRPGAVTTSSDVYGLGGILYALLTGRAPFHSDSMLDTLEQVKNDPPEPPRAKNSAVERDLELICLKCLEKEPGRRYASGEALANELERYLDGKPLVQTRPVGRAERVWRWCRRNPGWAAVTTGLAVAITTIAVGSTVAYIRLRAANEQERASRARAEENLKVAREAVAYFGTLSQEPQLQKRGMEQVRLKLLSRARDFYATLSSQQPGDARVEIERAQAFINLAWVTRLLGATGNTMAALRQARAIGERLTDEHPDVAEYQNVLVLALFEQGTFLTLAGQRAEAETALDEALARSKRLCDSRPEAPEYEQTLAKVYFQLANLYQVTERAPRARVIYGEALDRFERFARVRPEPMCQMHLAQTRINLGMTFVKQWLPPAQFALADLTQAEKQLVAARDILEKLNNEHSDNPEYQNLLAYTYTLLGRVERERNRPTEAIAPLDKALAIRATLSKKSDVPEYQLRLAILYHAQAQTYFALKQYDRAKPLLAKAVEILEPVVHDYDLVDPRRELGATYFDEACLDGLIAAGLKADPPSAERQEKFERLTAEAIEQLRKSWDTGFLQEPAYFTHRTTDSDLDAFRDRDDFKKLIAELAAKLPSPKPPANP
jgi:tetratricopeptide (TPR) repeat protein